MTQFELKSFDDLTNRELFWIYHLRVAVFVVEQTCYYQEVDTDDLVAKHVFAKDPNGRVIAYARIIPEPDQSAVRIGRVVVDPDHRQDGLGHSLVSEVLRQVTLEFPWAQQVLAQAQAYLQTFYERYGFRATSDIYLEDGIPHLDMVLNVAEIKG